MTESAWPGPAPEGFDPLFFEWDAWRPEEAHRLLADVAAPWYVAAGWAIDLFLGAQRREHEDLEIAVPSDRFGEIVEALSGYEFFVVGKHIACPLVRAGELLETYHQTWLLDRAAGVWRLDVFREPSDGDTWIARRHESIRLPYEQLIQRTKDGIPYALPETILLFKAKHTRPKDDGDLAAVAAAALARAAAVACGGAELAHPGHRWLAELG